MVDQVVQLLMKSCIFNYFENYVWGLYYSYGVWGGGRVGEGDCMDQNISSYMISC